MESFIEAVKKIAANTNESSSPTGLIYGKVISENPVEIMCGQNLIIDEQRLILSSSVKRKKTTAIMQWETEGEDGHSHSISGEKEVEFKNELKTGENVIMIRMQGGQKFLVLDRVVD